MGQLRFFFYIYAIYHLLYRPFRLQCPRSNVAAAIAVFKLDLLGAHIRPLDCLGQGAGGLGDAHDPAAAGVQLAALLLDAGIVDLGARGHLTLDDGEARLILDRGSP